MPDQVSPYIFHHISCAQVLLVWVETHPQCSFVLIIIEQLVEVRTFHLNLRRFQLECQGRARWLTQEHGLNSPVSDGRRRAVDRSVAVRRDNLFAREFGFYFRLCSVGEFERDTSSWSTEDRRCSRRWEFDGSREEFSDRFDCWIDGARAKANRWSNGIQWHNSFRPELNLTTNVPNTLLMFVSLERSNTIDVWSEETDEPSSRIHSDEKIDLLRVERNVNSSEPRHPTNDWLSWRLEWTTTRTTMLVSRQEILAYRLCYIPVALEGNDDESVQLWMFAWDIPSNDSSHWHWA